MSRDSSLGQPSRHAGAVNLLLVPEGGPSIARFEVRPGAPRLVGRSSQSDVQLPDQCISRSHASLEWRGGQWFVWDRASRAGTRLNAVELAAEQPSPLVDGDVLGFGPWSFRVRLGALSEQESKPPTRLADSAGQIEEIKSEELDQLAQQRLTLLMEFASDLQSAADEASLASKVVRAVAKGTGHSRAAMVRPGVELDRVTVLAAFANGAPVTTAFPISRSLVRAAAGGSLVRLSADVALREAQSIVMQGISSALCAPVMVGTVAVAFLYVDNGDRPQASPSDAAAFLSAVAHLAALALSAIDRRALEERRRLLEADLNAARQAQSRLMPPPRGTAGGVGYALESLPGRMVAGDLFDVVELGGGRVGFFIGDVSGKGVGAAVMMAAAQTLLRSSLRSCANVADAVALVNREISQRSGPSEFISLLVGIIDPERGVLRYVDAGHGYWVAVGPREAARRIESEGGLVIGVDGDAEYVEESIAIRPGERLVVFSDGVVEQNNPGGEQFGFEGVIAALAESASEVDDIGRAMSALREHAQTDSLSDDVTIASLRVGPA